ncbi:MAG TPA: amino acid adenylation domain-containing protein [Thermoanaerobaculia bacterium]|nr:amino acid adenylation domain-containing protein [Thermoanaerobaculia bacterium]
MSRQLIEPADGTAQVEQRLAALWAEVLEVPVEKAGGEASFFALGGDSLLAARLLHRIQEAFGVELSLDELFAAPTLSRLADALQSCRSLPPGAAASPAPPPLARVATGPVPVSFSQRRLWFTHVLAPANPVHNLAGAVRASGRLDPGILAPALAAIVRRHEPLRTRFSVDPSNPREPLQIVAPAAAVRVPILDLAALPRSRAASEARRQALALGRMPFDLESRAGEPLLRCALLRLRPDEDELLLVLHHIAADGWSLGLLLHELAALYEASGKRRTPLLPPPLLPPLPVTYRDFTLWQRQWLRGAVLENLLAYWRDQLAGAPAAIELPADRPRPAVVSHRGAHLDHRLPPPLSARLEALARRRQATPFMALLAAFGALLRRTTGQDDLPLGSPIAGRNRVELEGLIGVFINNLVLRLRAGGDPGLSDLISRVRDTALAAYAHQDLPFELLVDALQPPRDLSRTPLFQVLLVWQNAPLRPLRLSTGPAIELAPRELDLGTARFDLALSAAALQAGWLLTWKFSTDLFDAATVARMAGHLESLLAAGLADPELPLSRLPLLSAAEHHQLLLGWNDTRIAYPGDPCLHELFEMQAARTPRATAVVFGAAELTYGELDRRARRLADRLRARGVGPESLVGIAVERSLEMVVGLLAILKAGGAYLPLDPDYPAERLRFMARDAGVRLLLTHGDGVAGLLHDAALHLDLGTELAAAAEAARGNAAPDGSAGTTGGVSPLNPAYAIYTSGSTGRPKGVLVPHRGIVNRLRWMQQAYRLTADDRVLQKTPLGFDVSVWEVFWPLAVGARLVVAPPGAHLDAGRLAGVIRGHGITTLHFVPSLLEPLVDTPGAAQSCRTVRRVIASGEALSFDLKERFLTRFAAELHNLYGPTEASVDVTCERCAAGEGPGRRRLVPIGRPIANTRILVLDGGGQLAPAGVPGELYIGGAGLARGYCGRPDLTAERFVPDPLGEAGERLYRTGDLVRYRPDGAIEFLGRIDHQVKLRGVRIELHEIEAALARHPRVREAVVLVRAEAGRQQLVAHLVPSVAAAAPGAAGLPMTAEELRVFLRESLPDPMVPAAFVAHAALPLGPAGKVDRKALAALAAVPLAGARGGGVPRTALERRLLALWREVLGRDDLGVDDDFFAAGGDSIQGAMLANRLQQELGEIVYVMSLFDAPTVARLAALLARRYSASVGRLSGAAAAADAGGADGRVGAGGEDESGGAAGPLGEAELAQLRAAVARRLGRPAVPRAAPAADPRNRPAAFILSPFRSGSTLLRVMLAGHSRLFAPPELELLGFATMGERRAAYSGRDSFAREGLLRAVMELRGGAAEAAAIAGAAEAEDLPVARFYARLQSWIGARLLVDKTPSYALDLATLQRAEQLFEAPLYVHLVRHPAATIESYLEARMDQVYAFPFPPREQAELVWRLGHQNVLDLLAAVPARRQLRLCFEDLVRAPRRVMEGLGRFLGVGFEAAMLEPYQGGRMTDGPHARSRMMGDPKFHHHQAIDARAADRWRHTGGSGQLTPATLALAARLGYADARQAGSRPRLPAILGSPAATELPLSYGQERLWFLTQLDPGSPAYNMPAAVQCSGQLDVAALAASFGEVLRRHAVLRTALPAVQGRPVAVVAPAAPLALPVADLSALAPGPREAERVRLAVAEGRRPFDLARGPLVRAGLLRLAAGEHLLLVTVHHLAADGWSVGLLVRELSALYRAFSQGLPSPLPEPALQYADYARWQRRWLSAEVMDAHLSYWRQRLAGPPPALELPADRPRPPLATARGARRESTLAAAAVAELKSFGQRQGATLFVTLLAAWYALLHRYTGQDDLVVGVPVANRTRVEVEGLIGLFLNMVAQRTSLAGEPSFGQLVERVRTEFLASVPHQEIPFEKVVEAVAPPRDLSRAPIFQVQLSLQNTPAEPLALPGLRLARRDVHNGTTKFDLTVFLFDEAAGLRTVLEFNADLFDPATIERLLLHWQTLLAGAVAAAAGQLAELPLLSAAEREQLLTQWHEPRVAFPAPVGLHRLFADWAARTPQAVAAICEVEELTYRELDRRAELLARRLRELGVGPEALVGLCAARSLAMVVGVLGILKAGGAYVPLDPAYPRQRLAFILDDTLAGTAAPVLVSEHHLAGLLPPSTERRVVLLDAGGNEVAAGSGTRPPPPLGPEPPTASLAYVLHTSGSSGQPKGVAVTHANVVRLLAATRERFAFGPADVWTLFHSYAFDFSVWEMWGALAFGGRLVVVPQATTRSPAACYQLLASEGVTVLNQTPSAFRQLVRYEEEEGVGRLALRLVVFGGEALDPVWLAPWFERHGDARPELVNMYGITETTVHATWRQVRREDAARAGASPIGRPLADLELHLLGRHLELLPIGVAGEIHVGGPGLARGYHGQPRLTAERFIPDPYPATPGARLYRSGDLARRRADGGLDYLGRIDAQVKIRGFRIEPAEIESALGRHPGVRAAVVAARPDPTSPGAWRLVAWVVAGATPVAIAALRDHLRASLPDYMVPAAFVQLESLPLTPNGKVDQRRLPEPREPGAEPGAAPAAMTGSERGLAEIWRELLKREQVAVDDGFFDLGGHSLLVTQLASRVRARFGVELPLAVVFESPGLGALAARLDQLLAAPGEGPAPRTAPPIVAAPRTPDPPASFAQERLWFLDRLEPGLSHYHVTAAVRLAGRLDAAALARALAEVVRRHEALRTTFAAPDGQLVQRIHAAAGVDLPVLDLAGLPAAGREAELARLARQHARRPFDLRRGPLVRLALVWLAERQSALLVALHHIVADGWSIGVLLREVGALYRPFGSGEAAASLPALAVQYADFAVWQRRWLRGEVLLAELAWWRHRLAGLPPQLPLPYDRPRPSASRHRGLRRRLPLPGLLATLEALARRQAATLFMLLLAAFQVLLSRLSGQQDVAVGTPIANRTRAELEGLIGLFANTLVLRGDLSGSPAFDVFLARVRDGAVAAYAHQELPFEKLVQALAPRRSLDRTPLFQAMFVLEEAPLAALELPELSLSLLPVDAEVAKFDLSLELTREGGELAAVLDLDRERFEAATAERMLAGLQALLTGLAADPAAPVAELALLAAGDRRQVTAGESRAAPRTALEEQLVAAWRDLLAPGAAAQIDRHADFFGLGGHSLLALRLAARLEHALGVEIPLAALFEAPTPAGLALRIEALRPVPARGGSFAGATPGADDGAPLSPPLPPVRRRASRPPGAEDRGPLLSGAGAADRDGVARRGLPLSFPQQRFWLLEELAPGTAAYNMPAALLLQGRIDLPALAAALAETVRRHEALRTTFDTVAGRPVQVIAAPRAVPPAAPAGAPLPPPPRLPIADLQGLSAALASREIEQLARRDARRPFDLRRGPLLRACLLRAGERRHVLLLTAHHIASDGLSVEILTRELAALYRSYGSGLPSPLAEPPVQYGDFALWQREVFTDERLAGQLAYWRQRLAAAPPLALPADRPRPPVRGSRGGCRRCPLPDALAGALHGLARRHAVTLFMTLAATLQVLLRRWTGQEDFTVGYPVAGRRRPELEPLLGCFVNTLVLRAELSADPTFAACLGRVRERALAALAHQDVPFERLVEELAPARDFSRSPLFQVFFELGSAPLEELSLPDLQVSRLAVDKRASRFELTFMVSAGGEQLAADVEYDADLFDAATVDRMAGHWASLLGAVADHDGEPIRALPLLSESEWLEIAGEWEAGPEEPPAACLHELFATQAAASPDAVALVHGVAALTYRELARRVASLAARLRRLGVGPEALVGICAERGPGLVVAVLAVLRAGGAYLPLDPAYPSARLSFMAADARLGLVLTAGERARAAAAALASTGLRIWQLAGGTGEAEEAAAAEPAAPAEAAEPAAPALPANLAYTIYTSGSTGRPKGVQVTHLSAAAFLRSMASVPGLRADDRLVAVTTLGFDIALLELLLPLSVGATVVLAGEDEAADGARLAALLARSAATVLQATPATWRLLLDAGWAGSPRLTALCGGETLPRGLAAELSARVSQLWNLYGPTETTVWSTACAVEPAAGPVPIGGPVAGTRIHVADDHLERTPLGVVGELLIGGAGLARGYLGRPDLTAERFLPDPFSDRAGARLYRTGDLARRLPGGRLELLGRADQQVKVRGHRIELGEIAAALEREPGVREAVVVARGDGLDRRLVAFYAPSSPPAPAAAALQSKLRELLPAAMVPAALVALPALPRTPNGKVDRGGLPVGEPPRTAPSTAWAPARTPTEGIVLEIWREVLGVESPGVEDDFFALGGHSLLATQAAARLRRVMGVEVPLRELFAQRTAAALAAFLDGERQAGGRAGLQPPPIPPWPQGQPGPLSFSQQRLWFLDQLEPGSPLYNLPASVRLSGRLAPAALAHALDAVIARQQSLRTFFVAAAGRPSQVVAPSLRLALPVVDLVSLPAAARRGEAERLAAAEVRRPFDLGRPPLLRARLLRLAADEHWLPLVVHHIVADFWSLGLLLRELSAGYAGALTAAPVALAPLPIQYLDYAGWQQSQPAGEALGEPLAWWRRQLAGVTPLDLPGDRARPPVESFRGSELALCWGPELAASLGRRAGQEGVTVFMLALAAYQVLLHRWSGTARIAVGSPIANRTRVELEGVIGFFANTLVLVSELRGNPSFGSLVAQVRETTLAAYAHQELPFERLVEELRPERNMSHNPLFQVMLAFENTPMPPLALPGLTLHPQPAATGIAKFDLTLFLWPRQGRLEGSFEYNTDLFERTTALRLLGQLERLLAAAAAAPERPIWELPLLSPAELHAVLWGWNQTAAPGLPELCVHRLVERQAARTPTATALVAGEMRLSYRALDQRADQLARFLRRQGVGPEVPVGIHVERSWEMLVALLAVLKAGGAVVALDLAYPRDRIARIVADSGMPVLLTQRALLGRVEAATTICLDVDWDQAFAAGGAAEPAVPVDLDHPMYLIYTSGSTGTPKGIAVPHRAFLNLLGWQLRHYRRSDAAVTAQFATFGFCVSFQEAFGTWTSGGTLVLIPDSSRRDMEALAACLEEHGVERLHLPFAALKQLAEVVAGRGGPPPRLAEVITAGEQLQVSPAVRQLFRRLGDASLHNQYGASETHVVCSLTLAGDPESWPELPAIGGPVANVRIYLADPTLQPAPIGVAGELLAGGACLPRGYVDDPALTAAKLVPDPWGGEAGARLYRTGDLARYLPGGVIQYLGRADGQVKVRGYRVEPGEVEAVLRQLPALRDAAVVAAAAPGGGQRLLAYVVLAKAATEEEIKDHLRRKLPEYMVPAAFVPLAALPLNANGKLDREALPPPPERAGLRSSSRPPRGAVEELLAMLWAQVLGVKEGVGADDSFFDLGGHSLLATQLISRVREAFAAEIPLRSLFVAPTVAELARVLSATEPTPGRAEAVARLRLRIRRLPSAERQRLVLALRQGDDAGAAADA